MSVYVEGRVTCDEPGCMESYRQGQYSGMSRSWIIRLARSAGYTVSGAGADTIVKCPEHRRRRPHRNRP